MIVIKQNQAGQSFVLCISFVLPRANSVKFRMRQNVLAYTCYINDIKLPAPLIGSKNMAKSGANHFRARHWYGFANWLLGLKSV